MSEIYFITGAQGCIGSWIVKALVERGDQAVVFDRSDDSRRLAAIMDADDLAKPPIARNEIKEWAEAMKPVAAFPNIHCKLSGLVTEANWASWQTDDLRPYVEEALNLFGADRMMFGSDYPVCLLASSYDRVLGSFQELLKDLSDGDRDKIFSQNAQRFYRLS